MKDIKEIIADIAVSTRIRLARNVRGIPFPTGAGETEPEIVKPVYTELSKLGTFRLFSMEKTGATEANALCERRLISPDLMRNKQSGAAIISENESISVMINEEDHIRQQCFLNGFNLDEAFAAADRIDDALSDKIDFAFHSDYGYITACPTNLGTGLRASVMLFLPALTITGQIGQLIHAVSRERNTVRGVYGEGSAAEGSMYQLSNQVSLGITEADILSHVAGTVVKICSAENEARGTLLKYGTLEIKDRVQRAYGILTHAARLESKEFMSLLSDVKLGAALELLQLPPSGTLDELIVKMQPANIMLAAGAELSAEQRDVYRAEFVAKALSLIS